MTEDQAREMIILLQQILTSLRYIEDNTPRLI